MARGGSTAKSGSTTGFRIVVVGEPRSGKSSLIASVSGLKEVEDEAVPLPRAARVNVPPVCDPVELPHGKFGYPYSLTVVDTSSRKEHIELVNEELKKADAVVLTYSCDEIPTEDHRLCSHWLPFLRDLEVKAPVIVAGCKDDIIREPCNIGKLMSSIMQRFPEIEVSLDCSAHDRSLNEDVFRYAQKAVLYPTAPLYDRATKALKPRCVRALIGVFQHCDVDKDGALSDDEYNGLQVKCFKNPVVDDLSLGFLKGTVQKVCENAVTVDGHFTLLGFLARLTIFIESYHPEIVWNVLERFDYTKDLRLHRDQPLPAITRAPDQSVELTDEAISYLRRVFTLFGSHRDGARDLVDNVFFPAPESPWVEAPLAEIGESGWLSLDGFLSKWALMTNLNPTLIAENLFDLGFVGSFASAVNVTRARRVDLKKQHSDRSVLQCFVFGGKGAGKSSLMKAFVGRPFSEEYTPTLEEQYAVHVVDGDSYLHPRRNFVILREIPEERTTGILSGDNALAECDIAVFVYDSSNQSSFITAAGMLRDVASRADASGYKVPCLVVSAKTDLPPYPAQQENMGLTEQHIRISAKSGKLNNVYSSIVRAAASFADSQNSEKVS